MPRINVEDAWFDDPRRLVLKEKIGLAADAVALLAWRVAQQHYRVDKLFVPDALFDLIPHAKEFEAVGLARRSSEGVYICGSKERFDWLKKKRMSGKRGGVANAKRMLSTKVASAKHEGSKFKQIQPSSSSSSSSSKKNKNMSEQAPTDKVSLNLKTFTWSLGKKDLARWKQTYPDVDIDRELEKMAEWIRANPRRRKKNWRAFVVNWLARAQPDKSSQQLWPQGPPKVQGVKS